MNKVVQVGCWLGSWSSGVTGVWWMYESVSMLLVCVICLLSTDALVPSICQAKSAISFLESYIFR